MIKKTNKEFNIIDINDDKVFVINNKNKDKIEIFDKKLIENYYENKFNHQYKKLVMMVFEYLEDDSSSDDELVLIKLTDLVFFSI